MLHSHCDSKGYFWRNLHNHLGNPIKMSPSASRTNNNNCNKMQPTSSRAIAMLICLIASGGVTRTNAVPTDSRLGSLDPSGIRYLDGSRPLLHWHRLTRREATLHQGALTAAAASEEVGLPPLPAASLVQDEISMGQRDSTALAEDQPKGLCLLDGVLVAESTAVCEKQVGCRVIQKTGHCCPHYKCDCEKDGKTYVNGHKIVDSGNPCTVCFCKGGEITCSEVRCFRRDDCSPKYVPGRCCPEYDNCPVLNANSTIKASSPVAPPKPELPPTSALNPKITIKEITKPIEIRITDDNKPLPIHQMLKPSTTSTTTTTSTTSTTPSTTTTTSTTPTPATTTTTITTPASITSQSEEKSHEKHLQPSTHNNPALNANGNLKLTVSVAYPSTEHPSLTDGIDGDRTLTSLLDGDGNGGEREVGGDPSKVNKREYLLTTEEGLSLDVSEDVIEPEAVFTVAEPEEFPGNSEQATGDTDTAGSDNIYHIIMTTGGPRGSSSSTEGFVGLKESSTEGAKLNGMQEAQSTTEAYFSSTESVDLGSSTEFPLKYSTEDPLKFSSESPDYSSTTSALDLVGSSTEGHHMDEEDGVIPMEPNPAYPSLPEDDFSLRFPLSETDDIGEADLKDESRSIGGSSPPIFDAMKSTKHLDEPHSEGSGSGAGMITDDLVSSTTEGAIGSTSESTPFTMPEKIALMYSTEDASDEIANTTDVQLEKMLKSSDLPNDTGSGLDSLEMVAGDEVLSGLYGSGSGPGSGDFSDTSSSVSPMKRKEREPTTPRPSRRPNQELDIDELGSASGDGDGNSASTLYDPKLDVESLKAADDKDNGPVVKIDAKGAKDNILAVKAPNPSEDKTFEEVTPKRLI